MSKDKQIEEMAKYMLEESTSANVEPVLDMDGDTLVLGESAKKVLNNILEQAFIPFLAEKLYDKGYRKQGEEGAECPTCHGTGRVGTTDWLTKGISKKQLAEEKAKAVAEYDQHIKCEVARDIFEAVLDVYKNTCDADFEEELAELKKKYTEDKK